MITTKERAVKDFWRNEGTDYIADLGTMKRAIVIRLFTPKFPSTSGKWYGIGIASYFPFTQEQYDKKFDNPFDCIEYSEKIVMEWLVSITNGFGLEADAKISAKQIGSDNS